MDLFDAMKVFTAIVDAGSFSAAAARLDISRPAASKQVSALEDHLGVRLLSRTTRRVSATEAGRRFYVRARDILDRMDEARAEAGDLFAKPAGVLRVNAPVSFGREHLVGVIADYHEAYPDVSIDLALNDRVVDIVEQGFDLAVRIGELPDSSLRARKVSVCRLSLTASPDYIARKGAPSAPDDLKDHDCIVYSSAAESAWRFAKGGEVQAIEASGWFRCDSGPAVVEAAAAGLGLALEPTFLTWRHVRAGELVTLLPDYAPPALGVYAVTPPARFTPEKVRTFVDHLARRFGSSPYWDETE